MAAGGSAGAPGNGPIYFVGSRSENFYSEIYAVDADDSRRVDLTNNPASDEWPAVSPAGKRIAFVSHRDGYDAVYVMNADRGLRSP
jgi:TolB protein